MSSRAITGYNVWCRKEGTTLRMLRLLALITLGCGCLLLADDPRQKVQLSKTEHVDFPSGGVLRLKDSVGELTVESWDGPGAEITTVKATTNFYLPQEREKATKELDRVTVSAQRDGNELVVTTGYPGHCRGCLFGGTSGFDLEYRIKVPANTRLVAEHGVGEVHIDGLTNDIQASVCQGGITLHLQQDGQYSTDARSKAGSVFSEFAGQERSAPWLLGHRIENQPAQNAHKLYLRTGRGDIIIFKIRIPEPAAAAAPGPKRDGA